MSEEAQVTKTEYRYHGVGETDKQNRIIDTLSIDALLDARLSGTQDEKEQKAFCKANDFSFYGSGWQSWGFGGELDAGSLQKSYVPVVPQWKQYFTVPGVLPKQLRSKKLLVGSFFIYLRWNNNGKQTYLALASIGNVQQTDSHDEEEEQEPLPPVSFYVDRKKRTITCTIASDGKTWKNSEVMARLAVFSADDFFSLRDTTNALFASEIGRAHV